MNGNRPAEQTAGPWTTPSPNRLMPAHSRQDLGATWVPSSVVRNPLERGPLCSLLFGRRSSRGRLRDWSERESIVIPARFRQRRHHRRLSRCLLGGKERKPGEIPSRSGRRLRGDSGLGGIRSDGKRLKFLPGPFSAATASAAYIDRVKMDAAFSWSFSFWFLFSFGFTARSGRWTWKGRQADLRQAQTSRARWDIGSIAIRRAPARRWRHLKGEGCGF